MMPFSILHTICQAGVDLLCLLTEHRLSRPLECKQVRHPMCSGPPPSSPVPGVYTAPTAMSLSSLPLAQGDDLGDTKGQNTTLLP